MQRTQVMACGLCLLKGSFFFLLLAEIIVFFFFEAFCLEDEKNVLLHRRKWQLLALQGQRAVRKSGKRAGDHF